VQVCASPSAVLMSKPLKVLIVEDRAEDAELLVRELRRAGFQPEWRRVEEERHYREFLSPDLDVIFSDYTLPAFSTQRALEILVESRMEIPFIVVSGTIGEERAVEALKAGATDYILKDRLQRIGAAVERARFEAIFRQERRRMEEQLRLQATALENAANSIAITRPDGRFIWMNPAFTRLTGYSLEEVLGQTPRILKSGLHDQEFHRKLWQTILRKETWRGEFTNRRKDGSLYYGEQTITPVCGPSGEITHFIAIMNDNTEQRALERQYLRAQRMENIGTLAGGIAHDLNNALAPILMSIDVLRTKVSDPESLGMIELLNMSAQRGADMVKQLLTFSRGIDGTPGLLQPRHILRDIQTIARQTFPKNITVQVQVPRDLWPLVGDITQLHQVLLNLAVNARDAMPQGGVLTLQAENISIDEHFAAATPGAKPGPHVLVSVKDTGLGMPPEVRARIFDPFFTTKEPDRGTGLGLSIVHSIVKSHGGFILVSSQPGKGSEFRVYLPGQPTERAEAEQKREANLIPGNGEMILVVDDEEAVRVLGKKTLEAFGYNVLTAANGAHAVACCASNFGKIDLVLTDLAMPIMDGPATIRAIRLLEPKIKIIAVSGFDERSVQGLAELAINGFMQKPFTAEELLKGIREVLDPKKL
jgi:two-component system cell cycle sensor histidine kinase/response regulator CckA